VQAVSERLICTILCDISWWQTNKNETIQYTYSRRTFRMIARALQRSRRFFSPRCVSTSRYLVTPAGHRNQIRIIAEQRSTAGGGGGGGRILSRRNGSEWKSETRLAPFARSRVRLSSKRRLRRRDIGHNSNGSEIVVSAFASRRYLRNYVTRAYPLSLSPSFLLYSPGSASFARLARARVRFRSCFASPRGACECVSVHFRPDYRPTTPRHLRV